MHSDILYVLGKLVFKFLGTQCPHSALTRFAAVCEFLLFPEFYLAAESTENWLCFQIQYPALCVSGGRVQQ